MTRLLLALALAAALARPAAALDTAARAAIVIDMNSGAVLMEKNADAPLPPASMSKLMTLNMVFEALQQGRLSLDEKFPVSIKAWKMGGSKMFVREGDRIRIEDLIRGVIIHSGNDACVVLAEGLAGSEAAFARKMTERARELGLANSTFANATGWPDPGQRMSARDLITLAQRIVTQFPEYYKYFSETEFTWGKVTQKNRNPMLYLDIGADGLKTGHTEEAGYGLVASAARDERRVAVMFSGLDSVRARAIEGERLITWAFREFKTAKVASAGQIVGEAQVWIGAADTVALAPKEDVIATAPYGKLKNLKTTIRYTGPIPAPVALGQKLADLEIKADGLAPISVPLYAAASVEKGGALTRVMAAARALIGDRTAAE